MSKQIITINRMFGSNGRVIGKAIADALGLKFYDKELIETEDLIIPHVDLENRYFVLKPLAEIAPNFRHPILKKTVTQMLEAVKEEA